MKPTRVARGNYIQGQFRKIEDPNGELKSTDPGNLDSPAVLVPFSFEQVQEVVGAANHSFAAWKRTSLADRANFLKRYRDSLQSHAKDLANLLSLEIGKPLWESHQEVEECLALIDSFLATGNQAVQEIQLNDAKRDGKGLVRFLPRGVLAVVSPDNLPLFTPHTHLLPALIHGNTVILKASPQAPFIGQFIAELFHDAGIPAGVANVIQGDTEVTRRLTVNSNIDGVLYTGNFEAGSKLLKQGGLECDKLIVLEMGGKNATIVWEDADYKRALNECLLSAFITTGQRETSGDRILVHEKLFDRFLTDFHQLAKRCKVGYGLNEGADAPFMGPLVSEQGMEHYLRYQGIAVREGCEEVMRGKTLEKDKKGYYVSPSIHWVHKPDSKSVYQTSEIFGPNVALYKIGDLDEAAEIINQTPYGLVSSVYSRERSVYIRLLEDTRTGMVHWNRPTIDVSYRLPYGGLKNSGNARPMGSFAAYQCTYPVSSLEHTGSGAWVGIPKEQPKLE